MFYSQFILAKKGPLGTIWIAAHLERKLRKNQVADTDIGVSVDSILFPEVPIALRLSSHLLLGVVRIYSRKVNYLFHDCSEALLKVKQAFRSTAVDLLPEESTAPYHSITLPETFDLDDFELPDSDNYQGNFVDHHVSTQEQITLQDSMDGVVYSTSQFGLDERFGDGDTSHIVLDLDEELFTDKVTTPGNTILLDSDNVAPQASGQALTPFMDMDIDDDQTRTTDDRIVEAMLTDAKEDSNAPDEMIVDGHTSLCESRTQYLTVDGHGLPIEQLACTPSLVEEVVPTNGHTDKVLADGLVNETVPCDSDEVIIQDFGCNLPYELEGCDPKLAAQEILENHPSSQNLRINDTNEAGNGSLLDNKSSETDFSHICQEAQEKQQKDSLAVEPMNSISFDDIRTVSSPTSVLSEQPKTMSDAPGILDRASATPVTIERTETSLNGDSNNGKPRFSGVDNIHTEGTTETVPTSTLVETSNKSIPTSGSISADHTIDESRPCLGPEVAEIQDLVGSEKKSCEHRPIFRPCSYLPKNNAEVIGDRDVVLNSPELLSTGAEPCSFPILGLEEPVDASGLSSGVQGEDLQTTSIRDTVVKTNGMSESLPSNGPEAELNKLDECLDAVICKDSQSENTICPPNCDSVVPEPERLLSAPAGVTDAPIDLLKQSAEKEASAELDISENGSKTLSGRKRHFMESAPLELDDNAKVSGISRSTRTVDFIPDDNDLLSTILVGRRSSVLKLRPTPSQPEQASKKRLRVTARTSVVKRKVLLDDSMVLHGDTIRQQLTNTEDIRRMRKKAPCTRPEIWLIQNHLLEDEIFIAPIFTGMSSDLIGVHNQTYDVTDFRISELRVDHTLPEVSDKVFVSESTDHIGKANTDGTGEPLVVGDGGEVNESMETFVQIDNQQCQDHLINPIECDTSFDLQKDHADVVAAMEIDKGSEVIDMLNHADIVVREFPLGAGNISEHGCNETAASEIESLSGDKSNHVEKHLQNDGKLDIQSFEKDFVIMEGSNHKGDAAIHVTEVNEESQFLAEGVLVDKDLPAQEISESGSVKEVLQSIPQDLQVDACNGCSSPKDFMVNSSLMEDGANSLEDASTPLENDRPLFPNISVRSEEFTDPNVVTNKYAEESVRSELGHAISCEDVGDPQRDFSCSLEFDVNTETVPLDEGEKSGSQEANLERNVDAENLSSQGANTGESFDGQTTLFENAVVNFSSDFGNSLDDNDTEFLNFDDDEALEEEDNGMPSTEEAGVLDNSGWSSRT
ncbi:sister chromatid cohesion 1 protein 4-like, partial [Thalictrum thalictroides]